MAVTSHKMKPKMKRRLQEEKLEDADDNDHSRRKWIAQHQLALEAGIELPLLLPFLLQGV